MGGWELRVCRSLILLSLLSFSHVLTPPPPPSLISSLFQVEDLPFTEKNFYLDPVRPRLWDLLTEDELLKFAALPPRARPGVVVGEMKVHLEQMCLRLEKGCSVFYRVVMPQVQNLMACHEAMIRIRDTPVPYPFLYVLNISTFVFVYTTPFFYRTDEVGREGGRERTREREPEVTTTKARKKYRTRNSEGKHSHALTYIHTHIHKHTSLCDRWGPSCASSFS